MKLDDIRKRSAERTQGEWDYTKWRGKNSFIDITTIRIIDEKTYEPNHDEVIARIEYKPSEKTTQHEKDADFIASAPTDITSLLELVDRCEAAMKQIILELGSPGDNPAVSVQKVIEIADEFITEPPG